jgi:hypothetical protein
VKFKVIPTKDDRALLRLECPRGPEGGCDFPLWQRPARDNNGAKVWQWDGNVEAPTISPSIDCKGGCGRHFVMSGGRT